MRPANAQAGYLAEHIRAKHGGVPGYRCAPVMADNHGLLFAERGHQRDHIADIVEDAVSVDIGGRAAATKSAHVGRHDVETGRREC